MKLFIYIPTYNRPNAIRAQLSALAPQVANHKDRVRVLVSDNASPHGIYDDLQKEFGTDYIRFRKNAGNIGGNANIMLGFVFAKSDEFLWILSDNDIVTPTAIEYLISQLRTDIDFICAAEDIEEEEEIIYDWKEGWVSPIAEPLCLISAGLYNMHTVSPCVATAFYFQNSSFPHLAVFLSSVKYHRRVRVKLVPRHKTISYYTTGESPGDYSLSLTGMPSLAELMPYDKARIFCWGWLRLYGFEMYKNRNKHKAIFLQTSALLKNYGIKFRILFFWIWLVYLANPVLHKVKAMESILYNYLYSHSAFSRPILRIIKSLYMRLHK